MSQQSNQSCHITLSTQAFLILCRVFDGCYDECKQQPQIEQLVESIAETLLSAVNRLEETNHPVKEVTLPFRFEELFFLGKLAAKMHSRLQEDEQQTKTRQWLDECLVAIDRAMM